MIVPDMLSLMEIGLNNLSKKELTRSLLLVLLNDAQDKLLAKCHRAVIRELDTAVTAQALNSTTGAFDLTTLDNLVWRRKQGLDGVKLTGDDYGYCRRVSLEEYKQYINAPRSGWTQDPIYTIRGDAIYVIPYSGYTIDILYRREPSVIKLDVATGDILEDVVYYVHNYTTVTYNAIEYEAGDTFTGVSAVTEYTTAGTGYVCANCELEEFTHVALVGLALESLISESKKALVQYQAALRAIEEYNESTDESDAQMSGTYHYPGVNPLGSGRSGRFNILKGY